MPEHVHVPTRTGGQDGDDGTLPNANGGGSRAYYEAAVNAGRDGE